LFEHRFQIAQTVASRSSNAPVWVVSLPANICAGRAGLSMQNVFIAYTTKKD
jgi:hypothetical protein